VAKPNDATFEPANRFPAYLEHENVRLFRRDPAIRFTGRVHESVGWSIESSGGKLGQAGYLIHHFGLAASEDELARKNHFYRELGLQKIADMPTNPEAHLELGLVELDNFQNPGGALPYFEKARQLKPELALAWFFSGVSLFRLARYGESLGCFEEAEKRGHRSRWTAPFMGDACYNMGNFAKARECYREAVEMVPEDSQVQSKLGLAEVRLGRVGEGLARMQRAIEREAFNSELYDRLVQAAVWSGRLEVASKACEQKLARLRHTAEDFLRAASIRAHARRWQEAVELLRRGLTEFPESELLCKAVTEVEQAMQDAQHRDPGRVVPKLR
jgi:tetratricopeptide (TPR) repeat protein